MALSRGMAQLMTRVRSIGHRCIFPPARCASLALSTVLGLVLGAFVSVVPSVAAVAEVAAVGPTTGADSEHRPTAFEPLSVGGGGFVTGLSFSDDGRTRLVRTDVSGGYRWGGDEWELNVSAESLPASEVRPGLGGGVLAVAVAPGDALVAYMAFEHGVYRSGDGGCTWERVLSGVSTAPNDNFRKWNSRLVVDPVDSDVVYYGSQLQGLYVTRDGGDSWSRVSQEVVPAGVVVDLGDRVARGDLDRATDQMSQGRHLASGGISSIVVDRSGPVVDGRSAVIYAASYGEGVFASGDGGESWELISPPQVGTAGNLEVLDNGDLLVTSHLVATDLEGYADVWRYRDGAWLEVTPLKAASWRPVAGGVGSPGQVAMISQGGLLALSQDYGSTWRTVSRTQSSEGDVPWLSWALNGGTNFMSVGQLVFDPVVPGRLWLSEGTGVWYADVDASTTTVTWHSQARGIEELAPTGVIAPPGGKPLLTAWDRPIFRSEDPEVYPSSYGPVNRFGSAWSIDWSVSDPDYVVASVASHQAPSNPSTSGYSTDGGRTWEPFPTIPENSTNAVSTFGFGSIAVGAPGNVVWVPAYGKRPVYTTDGGRSWQQITLPGVSDYSQVYKQPYYVNRQVLAADKSTPGTFYLYVLKAGTFRTTDGGATWAQMSDNTAMSRTNYAFNVTMKAVPEHEGELYITPGRLSGITSAPFKHSTNAGASWSDVPGVTGVTAFGFGKPFPGADHPAIFIAGYVDGRYGIYRSTDNAQTWTHLTDYPAGRTAHVIAIDGDKDITGRVYLAIGGSGWTYGNLAPSLPPLDEPTPSEPTLTAEVHAPSVTRAGQAFAASVATSGGSVLTYRWSVNGCRVTDPNAPVTNVTCGARGASRRTLRVDVSTDSGASVAASTTIVVKTRSVGTRWTRPSVRSKLLGSVLSTHTGLAVGSQRVKLQARWGGSNEWTTIARKSTDTRGSVEARLRYRRPGSFRFVMPDQPGLLGSRSRAVYVP